LQLDDGEGVNVVEEILPTSKNKKLDAQEVVPVVVKEENDEDAPSKNWEDNKVHILIVI
jgi:hypothetical protein